MPARNGDGIELLADPTRRAIIAMLALAPRRPSRIAAALGLGPPAIVRQLRLLEDAGLIHGHPVAGDRRGVLYVIDPRFHGIITAWLAGTEIGRPITEWTDDRAVPPGHSVVFGRGVRGLVRRPRPDLIARRGDAAPEVPNSDRSSLAEPPRRGRANPR